MLLARNIVNGWLDTAKIVHTRTTPPGTVHKDAQRRSGLACAAIVICYIFSGIWGHDPWKADEAYVFGVIHHMLETGDWVVPTLAGEPFMEKPPLFYWVATCFARLLSGQVPLHDGARLASSFFMLIACGATAATARLWWGVGTGRYAALALIACLGTLEQSHLMMPDIALLASFALSALGFATLSGNAARGGVLIGVGLGMGFLAKGLLGPAVMGATAILLPVCFASWRQRAFRRAMVIALLVSAPCYLIWPFVLYLRSPTLFMDWFWVNNVGRFLGFSVHQLGTEHLPWFWTKTLPWFTFPALPIALWTLWRMRDKALITPAIQYAVISFSTLMLVLAVSSSARCVYAWPLLIPLALLAAPGASMLPTRMERFFTLTGFILFSMLSATVVFGWAIMMATGAPPEWPRLLRLLPAEFVPFFDADRTMTAVMLIVGAGLLLRTMWATPARALTVWALGITLCWSLLTTLWMPWLDFAKSYRPVFASMPIPPQINCISSINLGEGERAMFRYVTGRNPIRREVTPGADCEALLVQREVAHGEPNIDSRQWQEVWRGSRPGVTNERFWLFERKNRNDHFAHTSYVASANATKLISANGTRESANAFK